MESLTRPQVGQVFLDNERIIIVPARAYGAIVWAIYDLVGPAAAAPLYYLGKKIGMGLVEEVKSRLGGKVKRRRILEEYIRLLEQLGFGKAQILKFEPTRALVKLIEPPSMCVSLPQGLHGACHIERGMMVAVLDAVTGLRHKAREVEHGYEPVPYCIIEATHC